MRLPCIVARALAGAAFVFVLVSLPGDAYLADSGRSEPGGLIDTANRSLAERCRVVLDARRPAPAAAPELLLVDSGASPSEADIAVLLLALEELGSERLVIGPSVRSAAERRSERGRRDAEELIEAEFDSIDRNIRASFDAIRYGSVRPKDAPAFIDALAGLVGASGDRLRIALLDDAVEAPNQAARALSLFEGRRLDADGALPGAVDQARLVIVDAVAPEPGFQRRLFLSEAVAYARLDEIVYERLLDLEKAGYMLGLPLDDHPVIAYDYAARLRAEALERAGAAVAWRAARDRYLAALLEFPSREAELIRGFDELIEAAGKGDADAKEARSLRDACSRDFAALRSEAWRFAAERERLASLAGGATAVAASSAELEPLAIRLNAAMAGRTLAFPVGKERRLWLALPGLLAVTATAALGPLSTAVAVLSSALAGLVAYAAVYLEIGLWLDPPLAALAAVLGGLFSLGLWGLLGLPGRRRVRRILARRVSSRLLRRLEKAGGPLPEGTKAAAILALRDVALPPDTAAGRAKAIARFHEEASRFLAEAGGVVLSVDETVVVAAFGTPLDAPRGERRGEETGSHALAAYRLAERLTRQESARLAGRDAGPNDDCRADWHADWRVGLSYGECAFYVSSLEGYGCIGAPCTHAKALASLAQRYEAGMLLSEGVTAVLRRAYGRDDTEGRRGSPSAGAPRLRRLDSLVDKGSGVEEAFYRPEA